MCLNLIGSAMLVELACKFENVLHGQEIKQNKSVKANVYACSIGFNLS